MKTKKKYQVILADPPYKYGKGWGWGAGEYYSLMSIEQIKNLKIPTDNNAHLYLWTPNALIPEALDIMKSWGFTYKTCITWAKHRSIFGFYFKGQTEQLLFGVKGKMPPKDRKQTTLLMAKNGRHSQKPIEAYDLIEKVSGKGLELFARKKRDGWDVIGNGIDGKDIREIL